MRSIDLPNFGFVQSRLPKNLLKELVKDCLDKSNKKRFVSGLTEPGVAPHLYLENNKIFEGIKNVVENMLSVYAKYYSNYINDTRILDSNLPFTFGKPWINYQRPNEYIPLHIHDGLFSYNIYVSLPKKSTFEFHYQSTIGTSLCHVSSLTKKDVGTVNIFPSTLQHVVYPFQGKETRITLSGNLLFKT